MCIRALAGATEVYFLADLIEFIFYCEAFLVHHGRHMPINGITDHIDKIKSDKYYDNHNTVCQIPMEFS